MAIRLVEGLHFQEFLRASKYVCDVLESNVLHSKYAATYLRFV